MDTPDVVKERELLLDPAIRLGDLEYDTIALRQPTAGELAKAIKEPTEIDMMITLIHLVAKVPRKVAEQIPQMEFEEAADFFAQFSAAKKAKSPILDTSLPT